MQIYLVGGAVRDHLLGLPVKERDYVVVGGSVEKMQVLGFKQVGKAFPVFLHPQTHEEYALARTEKKTAAGYSGFAFDTNEQVTLTDDLARRDLTINAMAQAESGEIIDPFHGMDDLQNKQLRHGSAAFIEDPVRILRIARFRARYHHLGFSIAPETMALMQQMVAIGEVHALVAERVFKEWQRALCEPSPHMFFVTLAHCGALAVLFPHLAPDGRGVQAVCAFNQKIRENPHVTAPDKELHALCAYAVSLHDYPEKTLVAADAAVAAIHDVRGLSRHYRVPNAYQTLAELTRRFYPTICQFAQLSAEKKLQLFNQTDAFRRTERFLCLLRCCDILSTLYAWPFSSQTIATLLLELKQIPIAALLQQGLSGQAIAEQFNQTRLALLHTFMEKQKNPHKNS